MKASLKSAALLLLSTLPAPALAQAPAPAELLARATAEVVAGHLLNATALYAFVAESGGEYAPRARELREQLLDGSGAAFRTPFRWTFDGHSFLIVGLSATPPEARRLRIDHEMAGADPDFNAAAARIVAGVKATYPEWRQAFSGFEVRVVNGGSLVQTTYAD